MANECRHLVYYSLIYLLKPWLIGLKQKYYDHLIKFESYNVHVHQHYPMQVLRTGPLNKIHIFGFKGFFFNCKKLFYGTANLIGQMASIIVLRPKIYFDNEDFDEEHLDSLVSSNQSSVASICDFAKHYFTQQGISFKSLIKSAYKVSFKNQSEHFFKNNLEN